MEAINLHHGAICLPNSDCQPILNPSMASSQPTDLLPMGSLSRPLLVSLAAGLPEGEIIEDADWAGRHRWTNNHLVNSG